MGAVLVDQEHRQVRNSTSVAPGPRDARRLVSTGIGRHLPDRARRHGQRQPHPHAERSVGCEPCTATFVDGGRDGRWDGTRKEECGLHIDLMNK